MRITLINQFYAPDIAPTAHLTASLAGHLAKASHTVTVVTSRGGYSRDAERKAGAADVASGVTVRRLWTPRLGKATLLKRLTDYACFYLGTFWALVFMPRQDVVISLTTPPFIAWAGVLHKLLHRRARLVLWNMDCYPEAPERAGMIRPGGVASRILQGCNRALFRRLDHLVCLDTAMADLLLSRYRPRGRALAVSIIPNWEDAEFFPADARHPAWDGLEHHGLTGRFVVLYLGNMGVGHEFDTVLDAAGMLADEPRVVFLFIGGGARRETVSAEASRRGLSNVLVQGYVPKSQTPSVMAGVSCSLITLRDSMLGVMSPSKLHSNLAMGLPVLYVGPRTSNVDDAIARFGCGVSLGVGDARGLAEAVRRLVRDEGLQRSMRAAARRAFDEAYNDRAAHAEFDAVLGQVAPGAAS